MGMCMKEGRMKLEEEREVVKERERELELDDKDISLIHEFIRT